MHARAHRAELERMATASHQLANQSWSHPLPARPDPCSPNRSAPRRRSPTASARQRFTKP
ncbi:hypothetical protein [Kitasatospora sp. NPDC059673]|uniref:hypothetical protein n=1 Tax=Kitasatospora sp. NPDC059673 TaxID=3346901 RepID=UPI0036A01CC2